MHYLIKVYVAVSGDVLFNEKDNIISISIIIISKCNKVLNLWQRYCNKTLPWRPNYFVSQTQLLLLFRISEHGQVPKPDGSVLCTIVRPHYVITVNCDFYELTFRPHSALMFTSPRTEMSTRSRKVFLEWRAWPAHKAHNFTALSPMSA
jgi:hypothetical protein